MTVKVGSDAPSQAYLALTDPGLGAVTRRVAPLTSALLVQALAADTIADSSSIAYSRAPAAYAFYQFSSWTERPVRRLPQLLRARLDARGVAAAVGLVGDPLDAQWLLRTGFESLYHDAASEPGTARVVVTAELVRRLERRRVARRQFEASAPLAAANAEAAVQAMSLALGRVFDELVPWLESQLG
jgi:ABC-type uncharacterized transport system auxiliary subunit